MIPNGATHTYPGHVKYLYYKCDWRDCISDFAWFVWYPDKQKWVPSLIPDNRLETNLVPIKYTKTLAQKLMEAF